MDWEYDLARRFVGWISGLAAFLVFGFMFWKVAFRKNKNIGAIGWIFGQFKLLLAIDVIWMLLVIECLIFIVSFPIFSSSQCWKVAVDYSVFAAPCLAGIFAGMSIVYKEALAKNVTPLGGQGTAPTPGRIEVAEQGAPPVASKNAAGSGGKAGYSLDYIGYLVSVVFLFIGYVMYVAEHFSYMTLVWLIIVTSIICAIAYFVPMTRRAMADPLGRTDTLALTLGVMLFLLILTMTIFVYVKRGVFSSADAKEMQKTCQEASG